MKLRLAVIVAVLMALSAFAQDPGQDNHPRRGEGQGPAGMRRGGPGGPGMFLPPDLNLTDDQKSQVEAIRKEERSKMEAVSKQSLTREEFRTQAMAIQKESRDRVEGILTADQKAKLAEHAQRGPGGPGGPNGPRPERRGPPPPEKQ